APLRAQDADSDLRAGVHLGRGSERGGARRESHPQLRLLGPAGRRATQAAVSRTEETSMRRVRSLSPLMLAMIALLLAGPASSQPTARGHGAEAHDMELVGHDELQGRSAYQPTIHQHGARVIAYVGHHGGRARNPLPGAEDANGTSNVHVPDPANPRYLVPIACAPGTGQRAG